ncbi:MAG: F0F1 ATP synthase subunit B [Streptococcaceae bacterium]|jgi:F-type H+-transporting ATPase subunit b|nr:F0F1 ATP synthase subunit B [Streptococcaceae bacterium]
MFLAETAPANTIIGNVIVVTGAFIILVFLLRKFAWKQITAIFEARAKKITDDINAAEDAHKTADKLVTQRETELSHTREEASDIVKTATVTAAQTRQNILEETMTEVTKRKQHASDDIANERETALKDVKSDVASISVQIAEKLIGTSIDADGQSALINSYLAKLGDNNGN